MDSKVAELWATYLEVVVAAVAALGLLWAAIKRIYRMARNVEDLVDSHSRLETRIDAVEKTLEQLQPNGGSTMHDAVNRIEAMLRDEGK